MFRRLTQALRRLARRTLPRSPVPEAPPVVDARPLPVPEPPRRRASRRRASPRATHGGAYYDLHDDFRAPGRLELSDPVAVNGPRVDSVWLFTSGAPVRGLGRLRLTVKPPGPPLDFTLAGAGLTPVVSERVAAIFAELAPEDVQLLPVEVEHRSEPYFILVATRLVRCIDERACAEVLRYTPGDGLPERVGQYRAVQGLRIDPSRLDGARVFRTWGWPVTLIVSEGIKEALEHAGVTGARFAEVTAPDAKPGAGKSTGRKRVRKKARKPTR